MLRMLNSGSLSQKDVAMIKLSTYLNSSSYPNSSSYLEPSRVRTLLAGACIAIALVACTPEYTLKSTEEYVGALQLGDHADVQRTRHYVLSRRSKFLLGRVDAGDDTAYRAIGQMVTRSFERYFDDVIVAQGHLSDDEVRRSARTNGCNYSLAVIVEYWDDSHDRWVDSQPVGDQAEPQVLDSTRGVMSAKSFKSGRANAVSRTNDDQTMRVRMTVRDSVTNQLVDSIVLKSQPGYLGSIDDESIKLLEPALDKLAASLAGVTND